VDEKAGFWRRFGAAFIDGVLLIAGGYFGYFHGGTGQTPGDAALSIRVVDVEGRGPIGWGRALGRWVVSYLSGVVLLIGYLWMIWDPEKQTWHDKAARTYVVVE
jgi:uncharacterized RDD family membrane protein YckC